MSAQSHEVQAALSGFKNLRDHMPATAGSRPSFPPNEVRLAVHTKKGGNPAVRIVLGEEVVKNLNWQIGDKVDILFSDESLFVRRTTGAGWSLNKEPSGRLRVAFTDGIGRYAKTISSAATEYGYFDGGLLIDW